MHAPVDRRPVTRREALQLADGAVAGLAAGTFGLGCAARPRPAEDVAHSACPPLLTAVGLTGNAAQDALAHEASFGFRVTSVEAHLVPQRPEAEFAARLQALAALAVPVRVCNVFLPQPYRVTGPAADHDAIAAYARAVLGRAARAGVDRIVFGSAAARNVPEGFPQAEARAQLIALLRRLGPLAQEAGVRLMPENLNRGECNFVTKVQELVSIVAEVAHPFVRMTVDLYHMAREDEDPALLAEVTPWLGNLEIAERAARTVPGTAGDDFRPYFRALLRGGWSGWLNVEAAPATAAGYRQMFATLRTQVREASS